MDDFHVYKVRPEWVIELGAMIELAFSRQESENRKPSKKGKKF